MVDTEQTGKKLLQHGQLKRRVTIIPLNKISARCIDDQKIRRAEQLVSIHYYTSIHMCTRSSTGDASQHVQLNRHVTIIPLNKISARCIDDQKIRRAEQLVSIPLNTSLATLHAP